MQKDEFWQQFKQKWGKNYIQLIRKPVVTHRKQVSEQFENRIDYVDMSAFGIHKEETPMIYEGYNLDEFEILVNKNVGVGKLSSTLKKLEDNID